MAVIENQIKLDEKAVNRIIKFLKEIFNQPKWLMIMVILVITGVAMYFWYSTSSERTSIQDLQEQVEEINKVVNQNLSIDYDENLLNVITSIKLLKQEDQQSYEDELLELSLLITFIEKYHPNDPIVVDLKSMQSRLQANHNIYKQHFDYVMRQLDAAVSDTIK